MFAHAIAQTFQKRNFLEEFFAPVPVEQRYCPVNDHSRGPAQYLERHEPNPALVAEEQSHVSDQTLDDQDLWDYIRESIADVVPNPKTVDVTKATAFHNVTSKQLPSCYHETGEVLMWNYRYVPRDHPARQHCGEGPFLVIHDQSYITMRHMKGSYMEPGMDRLVLMNLRTRVLIIAHGGYFSERKRVSLQYRLADANYTPRLSRSAV